MQKIHLQWIILCMIVLCITFSFSISVYAEENLPVDSPESLSTSQSETTVEIEESNAKDEQIRTLLDENRKNQDLIQTYQNLYSTWTVVLTALLAVFGVLVPILLPIIINKLNSKKLDQEISKFREQNNKQYEKMVLVQNALVLSSFEDYWASNECFKKIQVSYPDDPYIKIYIARNLFREICSILENDDSKIVENTEKIYATINSFIDWYYDTDGKLMEKLMIGNIYSDSTVIEVATLINFLGSCQETNSSSEFIKICKKACKYILDSLKISNEEDLFDYDQTHVFIMNYKELNFLLCKAYCKTGNKGLKDQLKKTIELYKIDDFSMQDDNLQQCENMLGKINGR